MPKQILVTGAAGFWGRFTCEYLVGLGETIEVTGTDIFKPDKVCCNKFVVTDMLCAEAVENLVKQSMPDYVIHLAGTYGDETAFDVYKVNVLSVIALLEAVRKYAPDAVVIIAGSAAEYGRIEPGQLPVDEQTLCSPVTHYGMSKKLASQVALYYHDVYKIGTMVIRPFQLIGKGVTARLAPGAFAKRLQKAVVEGSKVIKVGNLDSSRDFLDVRDAVEAVWMLCRKPAGGEMFNLCSGKPTKIYDLLQEMIKCCGAPIKVEVDATLLRGQADVSVMYGSYQKIMNHCGWRPKISLSQSIQAMFEGCIPKGIKKL